MIHNKTIDKPLLLTIIVLVIFGFFIFCSASLGLLARADGVKFSTVALKQLIVGVGLGTLALLVFSRIDYRFLRKYSLIIFGLSLFATALVFVPHIGFSHGGAARWLSLGFFSFQPAEFLKIGFVLYFAAWLASVKDKVADPKFGLLPFLGFAGIAGILLLLQPDTGTFITLFAAGLAMYIVAGAPWLHLVGLGGLSLAGLAGLVTLKPYLMARLLTFVDPSRDPLGAGYQIQQGLIAVGSGGIFGRGFGQSVQKFNFLPEPVGDSIFAVLSEEFGIIGGVFLIGLFIVFAMRALKIAAKIPDTFGGLVIVGIVILIISQSFLNIGSVLGVMPFTGEPLAFVSQGGTAMLFALAEAGIILNISKFQRA